MKRLTEDELGLLVAAYEHDWRVVAAVIEVRQRRQADVEAAYRQTKSRSSAFSRSSRRGRR